MSNSIVDNAQLDPPVEIELECRDLSYSYAGSRTIFKDVNLRTGVDELVAIVGPSGTGKSTLLRVIAHLIPPTSGRVYLRGEEVISPSPRIALIHQSIATLPWMTALDNVRLVLRNTGKSQEEITETANRMLEMVGLSGQADYYPKEMSGGMRQRIAIARALAAEPAVLLMDEPFVHLDEMTADALRREIHTLVFNPETTLKSVILVSHNLNEVVQLADRVYMVNGTPATVTDEIKIELPRPRSEEDPMFHQYAKLLYHGLEQKHEGGSS